MWRLSEHVRATRRGLQPITNLEQAPWFLHYCTGPPEIALSTTRSKMLWTWSGQARLHKGATIDLVVTQQTNTNDAIFDSAQYVVNNTIAPIINVSYGQCELFLGTSGNAAYNSLWQSAAAAEIAVFVATGDSGSPSCDQGGCFAGTHTERKMAFRLAASRRARTIQRLAEQTSIGVRLQRRTGTTRIAPRMVPPPRDTFPRCLERHLHKSDRG